MEVVWEYVGEGNVNWIETEEKFTQIRLSHTDGTFIKQFIGVFAKVAASHWVTENNYTVVGRWK